MNTAMVTGASSGLGRGLALALAHRGVKVYAAARRKQELDQLASDGGGLIEPMILDVGDPDATHDAVQKLGALDLVIANAGIGGVTAGKHLEWPLVKRILQVNLLGAAATLTGALPAMVARGSGHIVGVSSIAAWRGLPKSAAYSASKAGLSIFLESLRVDLHGTGVAVTTICPGFVRTPMNANPKHPTPFIIETEEAVRIMMHAIDKREALCSFPLPLVAAARWLPFLPQAVYQFVATKT